MIPREHVASLAELQLGRRSGALVLAIAAAAAWLRKPLGKNWRVVHYLNYLAFWLVTAHAILIGSSFQGWAMRGVAVVLALITVAVLIQKRLPKRKKTRQ